MSTKKSKAVRKKSSAVTSTSKKASTTKHTYTSKLERVALIRKGLSYDSIETISIRLQRPVKAVLSIVGMPQTTYNKKKSTKSMLDSRNSELILLINDLIDYGTEVFNREEEKFLRWMGKPNVSLGGNTPESLLDTTTGIAEVRNALNRLEFGNLA